MSKKEEQSKEYSFNIPSEVYNTLETDADKLLWKTETERAFEAGWDAAIENITKNSFITEFWWIKPIMYATSDLRLPDINNDDKVRVITIKEE